jgi:hypothetical protein
LTSAAAYWNPDTAEICTAPCDPVEVVSLQMNAPDVSVPCVPPDWSDSWIVQPLDGFEYGVPLFFWALKPTQTPNCVAVSVPKLTVLLFACPDDPVSTAQVTGPSDSFHSTTNIVQVVLGEAVPATAEGSDAPAIFQNIVVRQLLEL